MQNFTILFFMVYTNDMKRYIIFLVLCFISISLFAEEFELFPWTTTKDTIINTLSSKGYTYKENKQNNLYKFYPKENILTYKDEPVNQVSFQFNKADIVVTQNITLENNYNPATGFFTLMCLATDDKAKLVDCNISNENGVQEYTYFAELENCNSSYMLLFFDNKSLLGIMYTILPF